MYKSTGFREFSPTLRKFLFGLPNSNSMTTLSYVSKLTRTQSLELRTDASEAGGVVAAEVLERQARERVQAQAQVQVQGPGQLREQAQVLRPVRT